MPLREPTEIFNQSPPFADVDLYATDAAFRDACRDGGISDRDDLASLTSYARSCGSAEALDEARLANEHAPTLQAFDAQGRRRDEVAFHPAYHALMARSAAAGLASAAWEAEFSPASTDHSIAPRPWHASRAARLYLAAQMEAGHCCPLTMTNAAASVLGQMPELFEAWFPRVAARSYDPRGLPAPSKSGVTLGMALTERQGGTDVRANTTRAEPVGHPAAGEHRLTGHKWFMSAPMSDAFLVLAQAPAGLSCFLVPRILPDSRANAIHLLRLKDKLGNRSNATAEVDLAGAHGWLVGEPGHGVRSIIGMVTLTRLDCAVASAGLMRSGLAQAIHHTRHRAVFGRPLAEQPVMTEVLADMALDVEAATALVLRLASAFDEARNSETASAWVRVMTPAAKAWVCKLAPPLVAEAMECLGGNGYVEQGRLARLYREVPVNSIWEGSGNVMTLDVLRVLQREPDAVRLVLDGIEPAARGNGHLKAGVDRIEAILAEPRLLDRRARELAELLAVVAAGAILVANAPAWVADAFIASRISGFARATYGQGIHAHDAVALVDRALPA